MIKTIEILTDIENCNYYIDYDILTGKELLRHLIIKRRSDVCLWNVETIFFLKEMPYNMCVRTGEHPEMAKFNEFPYHTIFLESLCAFQIPESLPICR